MAVERKKQFTLTPLRTVFAFIMFPIFSASILLGGMGLFVLTDDEGTGTISKSAIGPVIKTLTDWNTFTLPLILNFGLIGELCF